MSSGASGRDNRAVHTLKQLAGLPAPVARYFEFALTPGQPLIAGARFEQHGAFRRTPADDWHSFTALHAVATLPPSFVWDATIHLGRFMAAHVRDSYEAGEGATKAKLGGLVTIVDVHGTPEMATAALLRWLAEAPWYPTALLPRPGLAWTPVDASSARVTVTDGATTAWLDMRFAPSGEIVGSSSRRHREVDGAMVLTPWLGEYGAYRRIKGMMIPTEAAVSWQLRRDEEFTYWRGQVDRAEYELAHHGGVIAAARPVRS